MTNQVIKNQRLHTKNRAVERCNIHINRSIYRTLSAKIRDGDKNTKFLSDYSNASTLWAVKHEKFWLVVLFDKRTKQIATVMPNNVYERYKDKILISSGK